MVKGLFYLTLLVERIIAMPDVMDEAVLEQVKQGDLEAFGTLYERYVSRIYNYVYYRTRNSHDAEDLTARVFYRAMRRISQYQDRGLPISAWLYRIAHNLVANWHRDRSRRAEIPLDEGSPIVFLQEHPESALLDNEERDNLFQVIQQLPADRQQLLILKFVEHMSNAEIGQIMGRTEGAVKSLYHRTLLALRDDLAHLMIIGVSEEKDAADLRPGTVGSTIHPVEDVKKGYG
jgi:RNA polymerase sigma-70 factor, ECF subfamily